MSSWARAPLACAAAGVPRLLQASAGRRRAAMHNVKRRFVANGTPLLAWRRRKKGTEFLNEFFKVGLGFNSAGRSARPWGCSLGPAAAAGALRREPCEHLGPRPAALLCPARQVLPRALGHMLGKADEATRARVNKVIRVWDERKVGRGSWLGGGGMWGQGGASITCVLGLGAWLDW